MPFTTLILALLISSCSALPVLTSDCQSQNSTSPVAIAALILGGSAILAFPLVLIWHYWLNSLTKDIPRDSEMVSTRQHHPVPCAMDTPLLPVFPRAALPTVQHITLPKRDTVIVRDKKGHSVAPNKFVSSHRPIQPDVPVSVTMNGYEPYEPYNPNSRPASIAQTDVHFVTDSIADRYDWNSVNLPLSDVRELPPPPPPKDNDSYHTLHRTF